MWQNWLFYILILKYEETLSLNLTESNKPEQLKTESKRTLNRVEFNEPLYDTVILNFEVYTTNTTNNTHSYEVLQSFVDDKPGNLSNLSYDEHGVPVVDIDPLSVIMLQALLTEHNEFYHQDFPGHRTIKGSTDDGIPPNDDVASNVPDIGLNAAQLDPSLKGKYYHTDGEDLLDMIKEKPPKIVRHRRAFFNKQNVPWPNGEYFYVFDTQLSPSSKENILKSFQQISEKVPCVKFLPASRYTPNYTVHTSRASGCFASTLGFKPGVSILNVGQSCDFSVTMHEIFHILGAIHTQNRPDRDKYVNVHWEKIMPSMMQNFRKTQYSLEDYDYEYDYESTMQYPEVAFARVPGTIVLSPNIPTVTLPRYSHTTFSSVDYQSLRDWYGCGKRCPFDINCVESDLKEADIELDYENEGQPQSDKNKRKTQSDTKFKLPKKKTQSDTKFKLPVSYKSDNTEKKQKRKSLMRKIARLFERKGTKKRKYQSETKQRTSMNSEKQKRRSRREVPEVDCLISPWSEWSECTDNQIRTRYKTIIHPAEGNSVKCPPDSELFMFDSCRVPTQKSETDIPEGNENGREKLVTNMKKLVSLRVGDPLVLVVSNPKDYDINWYHVKNGEDLEIGQSDGYKTDHTSAGNNRLILKNITSEYDEDILVCKVYLPGNTVLRIAWSIEIIMDNEV